jgi:hypothetical protein
VAKKVRKKITTVREHLLKVPVSKRNPTGRTIRDRHVRRLKGTYLDLEEIESVFKNYDRKSVIYPSKGKLKKYKDSDKYDEVMAVWTDYFNRKFNADPPIDPDVVKALIASESSFNPNPPGNRAIALGIAQVTKKTFKILLDPKGEVKEFIFKDIRQKDLADPNVSIPMAVRWLHRKNETAAGKLKRIPTHEEVILEYKGLLKSSTKLKEIALEIYRRHYDLLKQK